MGSMIELAVGRLAIDYGKNEHFTDHSALFQKSDLGKTPYEYVLDAEIREKEDDWRNRIYIEGKRGFVKPLWQVIDRINLLGVTPEFVKKQFYQIGEDNYTPIKKTTFRKLQKLFTETDLSKLLFDAKDKNRGFDQAFINKIRSTIDPTYRIDDYPLLMEEGFEVLQPYTVLHLLHLNTRAKELPVYWTFDDIETGGYAPQSSFVRPLSAPDKFLIVTEGSSDTKIIKHAFNLLKPHIEDFFTFVDMEEGYPFTGTGNLFNFIKGLISISIQNNVVVLFDNDAEGVNTYNRCRNLRIPFNMTILKLPDMAEFKKFKTVGPTGMNKTDINGQAVAIECFLQLNSESQVRWKNYNSSLDCYQGELIEKDAYKKKFLAQRMRLDGYDYSKIEKLLGLILENCIKMKEKHLTDDLDNHRAF